MFKSLIGWLSKKAFEKFQKENADWMANIEAQMLLMNAKRGAHRDLEKEASEKLVNDIAESPTMQKFASDVIEADKNPVLKKRMDKRIDAMTTEFAANLKTCAIESLKSDYARLREIESLNPRGMKKGDTVRYTDEYGETKNWQYHEIMGEAEFVWRRCDKPYCKLFASRFEDGTLSKERSIYDKID